MQQTWYKTSITIASLFVFRMLGLFMLIPVFTVYADALQGARPDLIGLALGAYGLTQGILQIPFGTLSDKFGRKPILLLGFSLFAIGSAIGAVATSIYGVIFARIMQGAGAVGSVLIALLTDLVPEDKRTRSMAIIGSSIGISFSLAMILSPYISKHFNLRGIFSITTILALLGMIILSILPKPQKQLKPEKINYKKILVNKQIMQLNAGILIQHFLLTSTFFALPLLLQKQIAIGALANLWHFYLPVVLVSFVLMVPCIVFFERKKKVKQGFVCAVSILLVSQLSLLHQSTSLYYITAAMLIYFIAFNFLEANLPSLISKHAPENGRGTTIGIYSSCQFLGIFLGGSLAGIVFKVSGFTGIFTVNAIVAAIWIIFAAQLELNPSNQVRNS